MIAARDVAAIAALQPDDGWIMLGAPTRGRSCGSCTACCTQVPVTLDDGQKPSNVRCKHLSATRRCSIYASRPDDCQLWSCRWLFDPSTAGLKRPDIGGYIVDPMLDTVLADDRPKPVAQVWIDPRRRDAHRAPELRAYLADIAARFGVATIVRWATHEGMMLFAPGLIGNPDWVEFQNTAISEVEINERLAAVAPGQSRFHPPIAEARP